MWKSRSQNQGSNKKPKAFPRFSANQSAAIFIPTGYIPARKKPVINLLIKRCRNSSGNKRVEIFAAAPSKEQIKKTVVVLNRSAIEKKQIGRCPI